MRLILQLVLPADARLLPRTRRAIAEYLAEIGAPTEHVDDVILALDEACANVIRHAFPEGDDGCFRLIAEITDDDIRMQIEDDGVGFPIDEDAAEAGAGNGGAGAVDGVDLRNRPHAEFHATSGRGLDIIRKVMTSVEVRSPIDEDGGTRVVMTKRLREPV